VEVRAFFERILPLNGLNYADGTLDHEYCMNGEGDSRVPVDEALGGFKVATYFILIFYLTGFYC
jgi:hypothetical protein